jgi:hypothetical protein
LRAPIAVLSYAPTALLLAAGLFCKVAFCQTAGSPKINPATGMAESGADEMTPMTAVNAEIQTAGAVHELIFSQHYEEALQRCLSFHNRWKTSASLNMLLSDWGELARRYPKAKKALIELRDQDTREFKEGRGYFELFMEVSSINRELQDEDATYALFRSFRDNDRKLMYQCLAMVEGLLVSKGEYQWCYDHMGDPQAKFDSIHEGLNRRLQIEEQRKAMTEAIRKRVEELQQQRNWANVPRLLQPDTSAMIKRSAQDSFVGQTLQLIEVLVATGHRDAAEKIRGQATAVVDDARFKTAVNDAETRIHKQTSVESEPVVVNPS